LPLHIAVKHGQQHHIAVDSFLMLSLLIEFVFHVPKLRKLILLSLHIQLRLEPLQIIDRKFIVRLVLSLNHEF
jgi:hypothetical protein